MNEKLVLILNDNEGAIFTFKMMLKKLGFQTLSATNVSDALKTLEENKPTIIISDINLGENQPDGYAFLKEVRAKDQEIPFIFTSGYPKHIEWPKAYLAGATDYLRLPFEDHELRAILGNYSRF